MYSSSYQTIAAALASALSREGVFVGGTAGYPRVELHSFVENAPTDKGSAVRVISCVVESMSNRSAEQAAALNADNLTVLAEFRYEDDGKTFRVFGVVPTQLQELTETSDPQMFLYRVLQTIDIYVQQL